MMGRGKYIYIYISIPRALRPCIWDACESQVFGCTWKWPESIVT